MRPLKEIIETQHVAPSAPRTSASFVESSEATDAAESTACPRCEGARFVRVTTELGATDFGRAVACECVRGEDDRERRERLLRYSQLGALARFTFETLLPQGRSSQREAQRRRQHAVEAAPPLGIARDLVEQDGLGLLHPLAVQHLDHGPHFLVPVRAGDVLELAAVLDRGEEVAQIRLYIDIGRHDP